MSYLKDILSEAISAIVYLSWQNQSIHPSIKCLIDASPEPGINPILSIDFKNPKKENRMLKSKLEDAY